MHSEETHTLTDPVLWDDESRTVSNSKHCNRINTEVAVSLDLAEKIKCCMTQDVTGCTYLCQITLFLHYLSCFNHELLQSIQPSLQALNLLHLCPRRLIQHLIHLWPQGFNRLVIKLHIQQTSLQALYMHSLLLPNTQKITQISISFITQQACVLCKQAQWQSYFNIQAQNTFRHKPQNCVTFWN